MPYLHILQYHGPYNKTVPTAHETVEAAYRHHEGIVGGDYYYDSVLATTYEKTVMGRTLLLRQPGTGEIILEAVLSNNPVWEAGARTYVPQEYITWEVRQWDTEEEDVDFMYD